MPRQRSPYTPYITMNLGLKLSIATLLTIATTGVASAQSIWTSAEAKAKLAKGLNASAEVEHRTTDGIDGTARWAGTVGLDYKLLTPLKVAVGYTLMTQHEEARTTKAGNIVSDYWQPKHRGFVSLTGSYKVGKFELSLRERYQYTYRTAINIDKFKADGITQKGHEWSPGKSKHALRSRFEVEYNIRKKCPFTPYVSYEIYNDLADGFAAMQMRYTAGCDYRITKQHSVGLAYRYIDKSDDDEVSGHVIGVNYSFKF